LRPGSDFIVIIAQIGIYESWDVWRGWGKLRGRERASRKILVRGDRPARRSGAGPGGSWVDLRGRIDRSAGRGLEGSLEKHRR